MAEKKVIVNWGALRYGRGVHKLGYENLIGVPARPGAQEFRKNTVVD
jgi:hypothetical protein